MARRDSWEKERLLMMCFGQTVASGPQQTIAWEMGKL
jgi:hypothetical protein